MNQHDLGLLLNARVSLVVVETYDEPRALSLLADAFKAQNTPAWRWSQTEGLANLGYGLALAATEAKQKPEELLQHIKKCRDKSAFVLCDFHSFFDEPKVVRLIKDIVFMMPAHKLIFLSHAVSLPPEIARYGASVSLALPTDEEILAIIREEARVCAVQSGAQRIKTDNLTLDKLVSNLRGLPHQDVRRLAHGAIVDDGAITESDLPEVTRRKFELMDMDGVLHFEFSTAHLRDVGGLAKLKRWLEDRRPMMTVDKNEDVEIRDVPKGVLLFGVQGGGKSLAAKAIAGVWGLPLLRLDMGALFNKYVGETEKNLREALKLADMMSPCVLWMDEIEKGLSQDSGGEQGTGKRLLGTLLTWMSERKSRVFLVATSNDISVLPPELMRKGRFDEIFFVDLPDHPTRSIIFKIHLTKRGLTLADFDLGELASETEGFTGAEIEQAIVSAIYAGAARSEPPSQALVHEAIVNTQPLSIVMAESIGQLRNWASTRSVPAN